MDAEVTFELERDGGRVLLVPQFWPSDLDAEARGRYDGLRTLHVVDDGAISMPAEYLPNAEPGRTVTLAAVWASRTERHGALDAGPYATGILDVGPYAASAFDGGMADRDRIARHLLDDDQRHAGDR